MQIAVILLNWNAAADTLRCLRQLDQWRQIQPRLYVVDNASTDDSLAQLQAGLAQMQMRVCLLESSENRGFGGGVNLGMQAALTDGAQAIFLLNNDAQISEADMLQLVETLTNDTRIGIIGPLLYDSAQGALQAAGGLNPVLHHRSRRLTYPAASVFDVDYVIGAAALMRAEIFEQIGLLDERYFFSVEVADFCMRARRVGYRCVVDSRARAEHDLVRSSALRSTLYIYYTVRNRLLFTRQCYGLAQVPLLAFWSLYSLALIVKLWLAGQPASARAARMGLFDAWRGRYGGQNERVMGG
ncbi:MAG: glycosyltransferase family 2 protein [Caldilineaceae bacterium]|nr:glycosyltransferase family 2 protein [Caldilineaceae bacterium]